MKDWKTYKLDELGTIARGKSKNRPRDAAHLYGGDYPFVQTGDVKAANHRLTKYTQTYSEAGLAQSKLWPKNTMCITIAANIAETAILDFPACFPDSIIGFIADEKVSDIDFVEYLMQYFKKQIQSHSIGSVQDNINLATFQKIEFKVPPLPEQRAIASILSALDDKIELNLQMNKTLEEMAMTLYKHWFVDFGPFQDGNFVESELGLIPEGWEVKRLDEFYKNSQYGYTQSSSLEKIGPKFLRITDIQGGNVQWENVPYCISSDKDFEKYRIVKGDLFVARTGNSTGENVYILNAPEAVFASYLIRFQFDELFKSFYVAKNFRSKRFFDYVEGAKVGSAQPGISASTLGEFLLVIPPAKFLVDYFEKAFSFEERKEENLIENQTLTTLRDTLLPKLISGEVRVRDVEKQLSEVL